MVKRSLFINGCMFFIVGLLTFCGLTLAETGKITLTWDPIQDPTLAGYTVLWGDSSKNYTQKQNIGILSETTLELQAGKTYYLAVQGFDKEGVNGELSNEVNAIIKGPDKIAPVISNVSVGNVATSSATVTWTTNEQAYVQVEYGKNASLGTFTGLTNTLATQHAVILTNLSSATSYYFRATAKDPSGNQAVSETLNFRTKDGPNDSKGDPNAPIKFTQITLSNVSNTSVMINWNTDKPSTGFIEFGKGTSFGSNIAESISATNHSNALSSLVPSTVYRYRITAIDANGKTATSGVLMFKTSDRVSQPAQPSPEAIFIPSVVENGKFRTNLGINNLSQSVANVSMTLVDKEGMVLASKTVPVDPQGLKQINGVARFLFDGSLGHEIQGNLYLESDQPVSAWASQIDNTTNDPSLLLSKRSGTAKILIPSAANISTFNSSLVVMNVGITDAQVSLKAYGVNGSVLGQTPTPLLIPPDGILSFDNVLQILGVVDNYGPIEITSLNNVPLVAASRVSSAQQSGGFFEGVKYEDATTTQIIPHVVDNAELRTNLGINNVTDSNASVMVRLMSKEGAELGAAPVTVAAKGLTQLNNVVRQLLKAEGVSNFDGYIRLESNQAILGWVSQIDNTTNDPGFAVSKGQGATRLLVQSTANVGSFKSSLVIVNTGNADAIVDIVMRDIEGRIRGESRGFVIPTRGYFSSANILESLGVSNNYGPVEIISTNAQPLVATSRVYSTSGTSGFFEGQPVE